MMFVPRPGFPPLVAFSSDFALAATLYLPMNFLMMNYVHKVRPATATCCLI